MIDFETVAKIALKLPGVERGTAYGSPAVKVRGAFLACIPTHKSAEPGSLVIRVGFEQRLELLAEQPDVYYLKEHYEDYPVVLVRLSRIHADALRDLIGLAWRTVDADARRKRPRRRPR